MLKKILAAVFAIVLIVTAMFYFTLEPELASTKNQEKLVYVNEDGKSFINNYNERDYLSLHIVENNKLALIAESLEDYDYLLLDLRSGEDSLLRREEEFEDGGVSFASNLNLQDSNYELDIYYGSRIGDNKVQYVEQLKLGLEFINGELKFLKPQSYYNNITKMRSNNKVRKKHLSLLRYKPEHVNEFKHQLEEILGDEEDDYEKTYLISKWVSDNIFYDQDSIESKEKTSSHPRAVMMSKKALCEGYAQLNLALLRTAKIPARLTTGYGIGDPELSGPSWEEVDYSKDNHIWLEAYIDGRWIVIDPTWNSNNRFFQGEFIQEESSSTFFDMSLEFLSEKHRINKRY